MSVDESGNSYSSMAYLKRFPIKSLKIDQSFIRDLATVPDDAVMVDASVAIGHDLNLLVNTEGFDSEQQLTFLRACGCNEIQGQLDRGSVR